MPKAQDNWARKVSGYSYEIRNKCSTPLTTETPELAAVRLLLA